MRELNGVLLNDGEQDAALWWEVDEDPARYAHELRVRGQLAWPERRTDGLPLRLDVADCSKMPS